MRNIPNDGVIFHDASRYLQLEQWISCLWVGLATRYYMLTAYESSWLLLFAHSKEFHIILCEDHKCHFPMNIP